MAFYSEVSPGGTLPDTQRPVVIINAATSVRCRHYSRFADYLFANGFDVITYDYRGIGESRPASLKGLEASWTDWGAWISRRCSSARSVSFRPANRCGRPQFRRLRGGTGRVRAGHSPAGDRWRAIRVLARLCAAHRWRMLGKWHVVMPLITMIYGYFPGKRLGWLEDTPAGVVRDWCTPTARYERRPSGQDLHVRNFAAVTAKALAISVSDDPTARSRPSNACSATSPTPATPTCALRPKTSAKKKLGISPFFAAHTKPHYGPLHCPGCKTVSWPPHTRADGAPQLNKPPFQRITEHTMASANKQQKRASRAKAKAKQNRTNAPPRRSSWTRTTTASTSSRWT
jgi:predicted alpha/beta hydrolase